ncbi:hypothetical protein ACFU9O_21175 [Streptomyces albidoflavus]|uniref:Integral membrane protein n=1 Tax=Streptomyces albidoflavus TaxID=1886 RepID=A0ABY3H1E7_9ACTN|nr:MULTISPECIES: hypothetical protein [Streptomyces]NUW07433.1 hypothetical protein [Streptomyces sp. CAI-21]MCX4438823.1 hypothetical protein [Streptomyces albidoflavus]RZD68635.1 hypothetical protein C0Q59_00140 [Streptomyces albidoflavus]TWV25875.1 hypothetical protein FRZ02_03950 [Streptomyces albidoflavus]WTB79185.1 hypothetical protein OG998_29560 [Streptomyces albidoflavus]
MNRLLLAAYPASHRARHGDEVLGCLAEAYPGRSWPPPREVAALLGAGVRARAHAVAEDPARPWWLDGVQLAALVLAALALVPYLQDVWHWALRIDPGDHAIGFHFAGWYPWADGPTRTRLLPYGVLPLVCLVALARGRAWIALPASAAMVYAGATYGSSTLFGDEGKAGLGYYGLGAPLTAHELVLSGTLCAACAVLAACRPGRLRRHAYSRLVPVALALFLAGQLHVTAISPAFQRGLFAVEVAGLLAAWVATAATGDRRWLIPVAAFAFVRLQAIVLRPGGFMGSLPDLVVLLLLIAPLPALAVAAQRRQRRTLLELP